MSEYYSDVLIIGSGPAGCSAAIYTARANLKPIMVCGLQPGGQLTITTDVENYPGFQDPIQGPWLMEQMEAQARKVGTQIIYEYIINVDFSKKTFEAVSESGNIFKAKTVIICTGAQAKWLGLESEEKFQGFGVSGCATCDGMFFKKQDVLVVGGGNTALEDALYLSNIVNKVTLIHRRDHFRAEKILQDRVFAKNNIEILWNTEIKEILGTEEPKSVTSALIYNNVNKQVTEVNASGIFIAIGHKPNTDMFKGKLDIDDFGYIITKPGTTQTNIKGVFAAGDVQDSIYRQAVTAAGTGCMAALEAERLISEGFGS